jgi:pimeloyl-ACP methyl ester carboxylesterase
LKRSYGSTCAVDIVTAFGPSYLSGIIYIGALVYTHAHHIVTAWQSARIKKLLSYSESDVQAELVREEIVNGLFADTSTIPLEKRQALVAAMGVQPHAVLRRVLRREQDMTRFWSEGAPIIPLLVIHGRQDQICDHDALIAEATSRFRNVEVESWEGVGHTPMLERTDQFNNTVVRWVSKVSS